jgi:hypothetical protein
VVLFHSAEAWLIMASICGRLLLLGAVRLRLIWDFLDVTVLMTPGGCVGVNLVWPAFRFGRLLWRHRILSRWLWCSKPLALIHYDLSFRWAFVCRSGVVLQCHCFLGPTVDHWSLWPTTGSFLCLCWALLRVCSSTSRIHQ